MIAARRPPSPLFLTWVRAEATRPGELSDPPRPSSSPRRRSSSHSRGVRKLCTSVTFGLSESVRTQKRPTLRAPSCEVGASVGGASVRRTNHAGATR